MEQKMENWKSLKKGEQKIGTDLGTIGFISLMREYGTEVRSELQGRIVSW